MSLIFKTLLCFGLGYNLAWSNSNLVYKSDRFKEVVAILGENFSLEEVAARIALQQFDSVFYQEFNALAKSANLDLKNDRIKIRSSSNKIFVDGIKDPLIIGNSETLEIFYQNDRIPNSSNKSLREKMIEVEKFFATHKVTLVQEKSNWHNLLKSEFAVALNLLLNIFTSPSAVAEATPATKVINLVVGYFYAIKDWQSTSWISRKDWNKGWPFLNSSSNDDFSFRCSLGELTITRGQESFGFSDNSSAKNDEKAAISCLVKYSLEKKGEIKKADENSFYSKPSGERPLQTSTGVFQEGPLAGGDVKDFLTRMCFILIGRNGEKNLCDTNSPASDSVKDKDAFFTELARVANSYKSDTEAKEFLKALQNKSLPNSAK